MSHWSCEGGVCRLVEDDEATAAPLKIGVLISGSGTNLQAIVDRIADGSLNAEVALVVSSRPGVRGIERAREAALRELKEETGATPARMIDLGKLLVSPGCYSEVLHLYLAEGLAFGAQHPDEDEFVETVRLPIAEVERLIAEDRLRDAKTIAAMYRARLKNLF